MKKKTTTISIFTAPNNVRGRLGLQGFQKLLTMFFLWTTLATTCYAQGLTAGAGIVAQPGTAIHLTGNLFVMEHCRFDGYISLTGHFEDYYGLDLSAGDMLFNGDGSVQVIRGQNHTTLNNMEVAVDAKVHISPEKMLTVTGDLLNNNETGGLVLKADHYGNTASLIHKNDDVVALVEKYFAGAAGIYHRLSSPVSMQEFEPEFYSPGDYVYTWYEPIQTYVTYDKISIFPTFAQANQGLLEFLPAKAYYVSYFFGGVAGNPRVFSGALQQGIIEFLLSSQAHPDDAQQGLNLMGNPYPSAIDWNAEEGWTGKEYLAGEDGVGNKGVWVWNDEKQNYGAVLPRAHTANHNDVTGIIPAMQGFWVQAAVGADGEILAMDDRVRLHSSDRMVKQKSCNELQVIRFRLSSDDTNWTDEVVIEFGHDGVPAGAAKMFSPNPDAPQLFAVHHENQYSIILLNETDAQRSITLEAQTALSGSHTLSIDGTDALIRQLVVEDKHTGRYFRAQNEHRLHLNMPEGHTSNSFVLHFDHLE